MIDQASALTRGMASAAGSATMVSKLTAPAMSPLPAQMRGSACARFDSSTAGAKTSWYTTAREPEFSMQKSSSSALARQLTGVITMPASWQAQCSVAAASQFCSTVTRWSPDFSPMRSSEATSDEIRAYHCA